MPTHHPQTFAGEHVQAALPASFCSLPGRFGLSADVFNGHEDREYDKQYSDYDQQHQGYSSIKFLEVVLTLLEGFIGIGVVLEAAAGGAIVPGRVILGLVPLAAGVVIDCLFLRALLPGALDELEVLAGGVGEGVVEGT